MPEEPLLPAAASTALRATLTSPVARAGRVLAAFPSAVYVALDEPVRGEPAALALVTADGVRLPNALVVAVVTAQRPFRTLRAGQAAPVGRGGVHLPGLRVTAARWRDPHPRLRADRSVLQRTVPALAEALAAWPSAVADRLDPLALALAEDDGFAAGNAAAALLGLGPGLTPAGDDVLAGALATLSLLLPPPPPPPPLPPPPPPPPPPPAAPVAAPARPSVERNPRPRRFLSAHAVAVAEAAAAGAWAGLDGAVAGMAVRRTTALSAALLGCARRGQVAAPAADLLRALTGDGDVGRAARGLVGVGHSSGRDLAAGILLAARAVAAVGAVRGRGVA